MAPTTPTKDELVTAQAKEHDLSEVENASSSSGEHFDEKKAARIRHRVDWRLIPALGAMVRRLLSSTAMSRSSIISPTWPDLRLTKCE
jgi:hypothetical protein